MNRLFSSATGHRGQEIHGTAGHAPRLFIFDLDGVVFDSEYDNAGIIASLAQEKGLKADQDMIFRRLSALDIPEKFGMIARSQDVVLKADVIGGLCTAYHEKREALLDRPDLPLVYGALDLLKSLTKDGHVLAALTTNSASLADRALKHTRLLDFFEDRVYCGDTGLLPQILADTRFTSQNSVMVDDGLAGLAAAKQMEIASFGYADPRFGRQLDERRKEMEQAGATLTVEGLIDIHTLFLAQNLASGRRRPAASFGPRF